MSLSHILACAVRNLALVFVIAGIVLNISSVTSGAPEPLPPDRTSRNRIENWTLKLDVDPSVLDSKHPSKLTLALKNHSLRERRVIELLATDNKLLSASGLIFSLRFENGAVAMGRPCYCTVGMPREAPLKVPDRGESVGVGDLYSVLFGFDHDAAVALQKCKRFCVTAAILEMGLRSNTVFINGTFRLPGDFDPLKDLEACRQKKAQEEKRRQEARSRELLEKLKQKR
ncbi:MAG TPA: hypothetical protein VFA26_11000 [Gemmataceae bacterium]|nr:hypothetical protein [Gemmataceae bacterium]